MGAGQEILTRVLDTIRPSVRAGTAYDVGRTGEVAVKLNQNECPFDLPEDLKRELVEAAFDTKFNRYPDEQPEKLCEALAAANDWDVDGIMVGNGSNELVFTLATALIAPGAPVVLPRPMFSFYGIVMRLFDASIHEVEACANLQFDTAGLRHAVRRVRPALVVLTTPNNPTGLTVALGETERIVTEAPGLVLVDEAYVEFSDEASARALLEANPNLLLLRTFSKALGLAGLRIGYLMGHPSVVRELVKARPPFMIDHLAQMAALKVLENPALVQGRVAHMKRETGRITETLAALPGVDVVPSQGNFVIFRPPTDANVLMTRLADQGVLVRNMGGYRELQGYLRVCAGSEQENNAFLEALHRLL